MHNFDPLLNGASNLPDTASSPANADVASAVAAQAATDPQIDAEASAEAERLLSDLCGIKKPVLSVSDQPPARPAVDE
jgi:hypothetical protein